MIRTIAIGLLLASLTLWPVHVYAQDGNWDSYTDAGTKAYQQGKYKEAEKQWEAALKEAEGLGPKDPRLATSLNNLAELYRVQGNYAESEPLHKRALAIYEKALGREHPRVATSLNNLAMLYRPRADMPRPNRFINARWR